jgi:hypothetical protein
MPHNKKAQARHIGRALAVPNSSDLSDRFDSLCLDHDPLEDMKEVDGIAMGVAMADNTGSWDNRFAAPRRVTRSFRESGQSHGIVHDACPGFGAL